MKKFKRWLRIQHLWIKGECRTWGETVEYYRLIESGRIIKEPNAMQVEIANIIHNNTTCTHFNKCMKIAKSIMEVL